MKPDDTKTIKILWWNVNRRLDVILKNLSPIKTCLPHIMFVLETALGFDTIPEINGYHKFADGNLAELNHGGIVAYVKSSVAASVFDVTYNKCFISFRLDFAPHLLIIGAYIQPESSPYFSTDMFYDLSNLMISSNERKLVPLMGGDINCRFGDLNNAFVGRYLVYGENADVVSNHHGRTFGVDLCNTGNIFPLNHLNYGRKQFTGENTYFKGEKKSQIDFVYTNRDGVKLVQDFCIISENWHLSDHRPVVVEILTPEMIQPTIMLRRAKELTYEYDPHFIKPVRYLSTYDTTRFEDQLKKCFPNIELSILSELEKENISQAILALEDQIKPIYKKSRIKQKRVVSDEKLMEEANKCYEVLRQGLCGEIDKDISILFDDYLTARKAVSKDTYIREHNKWKELTADPDCKKLWDKIDWKGGISGQNSQSPDIEDLAAHFQKLHEDTENDLEKMEELKSETYVPLLDDPITKLELETALKDMKNGGFDHRIDMFRIIVTTLSPLILLLMNILFYVSYPKSLAISLLTAIPKKVNAVIPHFRGIQMLRALGVLYDRIITNRLEKWIKVSDVQSAFQKFRSTLHQIFTIRLLIELAKQTNTTLYIAMFDLEKAFDKVSRYKLLLKLVKVGIGNVMLQALKRVYMSTYCILSYGREFSDVFQTFTGIRQGAASSALLFIAFIDDLVKYLEEHCSAEPLIEILHCLLHADDTAIISTDRELFIKKCNHMLDYFQENSLSLNLSKSGYLIINGKEGDTKTSLELKNGLLEYKSILKYLGVKISDQGRIDNDVEVFLEEKRCNVTIKYGNFCRKNFLAPLDTKLHVLNTCVSAALIYGCETWGMRHIKKLEVLYRQGLKTAMSIRKTVNNEIVYIESGEFPLYMRVAKQQLKFWKSIQKLKEEKPDHYISKLVAIADGCSFIKYYQELEQQYATPNDCMKLMKEEFLKTTQESIQTSATSDENSKLGAYLTVNPSLNKPTYDNKLEFQRVNITRYRCGSHNLMIEKGRRPPHIPQEERLCMCNTGLQTVKHVLMDCPLLLDLQQKHDITDVEGGVMNDLFLLEMEKTLGVK